MTQTTIYKSSTIRKYDHSIPLQPCEHNHRKLSTAVKCADKRNPNRFVGSQIVKVFAESGEGLRPLTEDEAYEAYAI
ncbi:MAG: hypothetical protein OXC95_08780 [Dehalococcoidia bacterium]|nr:hypothetical protein [Dehalococcoidia bacterium]